MQNPEFGISHSHRETDSFLTLSPFMSRYFPLGLPVFLKTRCAV